MTNIWCAVRIGGWAGRISTCSFFIFSWGCWCSCWCWLRLLLSTAFIDITECNPGIQHMEQGNLCKKGKHIRYTLEGGKDFWMFYNTWSECFVPILTGNPGGNFRVTKSRSRAKWELVRAMRSMMGVTCSTRDRGWSSLIHNVPLNLSETRLKKVQTCTQLKIL